MKRDIFIRIMFGIISVFLIVFFCISCKEELSEYMSICVQNETSDVIHIRLYPAGRSASAKLYPMSDVSGGYLTTEFSLSSNNDRALFIYGDFNEKSYKLALSVFDSIHISLTDKGNSTIKFSHKNVTGYSENIFTENSTWDFEIIEDCLNMQFTCKPQKNHRYIFLVLEDKIIIE